MTELKVIYKSNAFILIRRLVKQHLTAGNRGKILRQQKLTINLIDFDARFFYSLVHLSRQNICFQNSNIKFFLNIIKLRLLRKLAKNRIEFDLDFELFRNNFESFLLIEPSLVQIKCLEITAYGLMYHDPIVLAWYVDCF